MSLLITPAYEKAEAVNQLFNTTKTALDYLSLPDYSRVSVATTYVSTKYNNYIRLNPYEQGVAFGEVAPNLVLSALPAARIGNVVKVRNNIAFGLGDDLFNFAESKRFLTYRNFSSGLQTDKILSAINNTNNNLHFNLTGFSKYRYYRFENNYTTGDPFSYNNITNWELHTILENPSTLSRTTFWQLKNGRYMTVPNPFK